MKTVLELAKEQQLKNYFGKHSLGKSKHNKKQKDTICGLCKRKMTVPYFENQPHYCYKCWGEMEAALR